MGTLYSQACSQLSHYGHAALGQAVRSLSGAVGMTVDEVIRLLGNPSVIYDDEGIAMMVYYPLPKHREYKRKFTKKHRENLRLAILRYYERKRRERSHAEKKKE